MCNSNPYVQKFSGYRFGRNLSLQAGVDNILDVQYRALPSGINGSGRNFWVTVRAGW